MELLYDVDTMRSMSMFFLCSVIGSAADETVIHLACVWIDFVWYFGAVKQFMYIERAMGKINSCCWIFHVFYVSSVLMLRNRKCVA